MAFQADYRSAEQAGEITLRRGIDNKLHADTVSDCAWTRLLCGKTAFTDSEIDSLLSAASEYGLSLLYLENELA